MSAESGLTRDKDGFLKCKDCPRRFLTELMFENHSSNQHEKETETKLNQNQHYQTLIDESSFPNNSQSTEVLGTLSCGSQVDLKLQSIEHPKISHHKCRESKKLFKGKINIIGAVHKKLTPLYPHKCQD